jgi:hypothetical protein
MERESFEDPDTAALMNRLFVNVKLDREERPDVDRVYMTFVQATTGGGGWPMSVWLTPELRPFYGGTYFPPRDAYGRPGFPTLLQGIASAWREKRAEVLASGEQILRRLRELGDGKSDDASDGDPPAGTEAAKRLGEPVLELGAQVFARAFDPRFGGFGKAPKFPRPVSLSFLHRQGVRRGDARALAMAAHTLEQMALGGMNDHLGGGFHRYSVDREWHVPHFEKMLYDQAQLVDAYVEAWQIGKNPLFAEVARQTCAYVLRDLTDQATGGFFAAEDADSVVPGGAGTGHGGASARAEGAYYVWTWAELGDVLGADRDVFAACYGCADGGNAADPHGELTGKNVLHAAGTLTACAERVGRSEAELGPLLAGARAKLLARRATRIRPHLDDKVITSWNGLMIGALARAATALAEPTWLAAAQRAARFVLTRLWDPDTRTLRRRYRDGEAAFDGQLEDYAAMAGALAALYQADFDRSWLGAATDVVTTMNERFGDPEGGGWFASSGRDPSVLLRLKEDYDGAEPSGASQAALALATLGELRERPDWLALVDGALAASAGRLATEPHAAPAMLAALALRLDGPTHVVIAGEAADPRTQALAATARAGFSPGRIVLLADAKTRTALATSAPWLGAMTEVTGAPAAYVCRDRACQRPVTDPQALGQALASTLAPPAPQ